ncbi:MAG TPA: hypothetical protein VG838_00675 [Opitutaceae bacterium]|nr:hypothetical protein [Opitutaceae bacterium]
MSHTIISAYVPESVARAIEEQAKREDRSKSKVAGRILAAELQKAPSPEAKFARRRRGKVDAK